MEKKKKPYFLYGVLWEKSSDVYIVCGEWTRKKGHPARFLSVINSTQQSVHTQLIQVIELNEVRW